MSSPSTKRPIGPSTYEEVGAYEAKTTLPELLRRVQLGQRFTITKRGQPVAQLIPVGADVDARRLLTVDAMVRLMHNKQGLSQPGISTAQIRAWRDEDRK